MLYIISLDLLFSLNLIAKVDPMLHIAIILFFFKLPCNILLDNYSTILKSFYFIVGSTSLLAALSFPLGIEPRALAVKVPSPNHWIAWEFLPQFSF